MSRHTPVLKSSPFNRSCRKERIGFINLKWTAIGALVQKRKNWFYNFKWTAIGALVAHLACFRPSVSKHSEIVHGTIVAAYENSDGGLGRVAYRSGGWSLYWFPWHKATKSILFLDILFIVACLLPLSPPPPRQFVRFSPDPLSLLVSIGWCE